MKETKILATFGPAIDSPRIIDKLILAGVNGFRVNCSHGDTGDFTAAAKKIRAGASHARFPVGLLFDISGPKLRLARFDGQLSVRVGNQITITANETDVAKRVIAVNHPAIIESITKGERVFIDDGAIGFVAESVRRGRATLRALNPGTLLPGKGINLPDSVIKLPTIGPKDRRDIRTAVAQQADFVALSFVRSAADIELARRLIQKDKGRQRIIAKLEKREAIERLEEIMDAADGVMIARGDLGVELPPERLPRLQKEIIALANRSRKPVIVATQMLESMRFSPRPTRAEVNDVASAVYDFADTVMLSAETATGKYPLEAVRTMAAVIEATEAGCPAPPVRYDRRLAADQEPASIARLVGDASRHDAVKVIFAFTSSGFTAELIANLFPPQPIIALTSHEFVMRRLSLIRGVYPIYSTQPDSFEEMFQIVDRLSRKFALAKKGDLVIITGGAPFGKRVPTNVLNFHEVT